MFCQTMNYVMFCKKLWILHILYKMIMISFAKLMNLKEYCYAAHSQTQRLSF